MNGRETSAFDLEAYFHRIGYAGNRAPTREVLEQVHLAHATHIPFENLDIQLGRPIALDLESLQAKLVRGQRGGYCFEQNTLFAAALVEMGFRVTQLAARVRLGAERLTPRTHMLLKVDIGDTAWLADVGFGAGGLLQPLPLASGQVVRQFLWTYRVMHEAGLWVLQASSAGAWRDFYAFSLEPQFPVDFEVANYYTSTHPTSWFVQILTAQLPTPEAHYRLHNREFTIMQGEEIRSQTIENDETLLRVLAKTFGLDFPPDTRFRCLTQGA
jgi:N-hydroxyarylamine O-acetyltransferase